MSETRKLAAILVADVVGYSRLAGADEDRTLARLRGLRSDLFDPAIAAHHGRIVKRTGDGAIIDFRSVVDAVRCAIELQTGLVERNAGVPPERRIESRVGIHVGDVVEEDDGDLMGDGVNIAARLEGVARPGRSVFLRMPYRQVKSRLDLKVSDLGATSLKNIAEPVRVYSLEVGQPAQARPTLGDAGRSGEVAGVQRPPGLRAARRRHRRGRPSGRRQRLVSPRRPRRETGASRPSLGRRLAVRQSLRRSGPSYFAAAAPITSRLTSRASAAASSSPATPRSPTRARPSTPRRSARSSASVTCSKARCSAIRTGCGSMRS